MIHDEFLEGRVSKRALRRVKDKDLYETVEEVFDSTTVLALYSIIRKGVIRKIYGVISAGKEARVYWAKDKQGNDLAVKIYLTSTAEFRRGILKYIIGDPRFENIPLGNIRRLIYAWTKKEFRNLKRLTEVGVRVPKPIYVFKNILVMEFIGQDGVRAPLLKEIELDEDEALRVFNKIIEYIELMYHKAKLVHADLSEYNVMIYNGEPVIIDVSQAVDISHPNALEFLRHDIETITRYFRNKLKLDVPSPDEIYQRVLRWKISRE